MFKLSPNTYPIQSRLSVTQLMIVSLIVFGMTNRQIAQKLEMNEDYIKKTIMKIFNLVGCDSRLQLANLITYENGEVRRNLERKAMMAAMYVE